MKMNAHRWYEKDEIHHVARKRVSLKNFSGNITNGDFAVERISANGQKFIELSIDPLTDDHESVLTYQLPIRAPFNMAVPFAMSQRARNSYFTLEAVDIDTRETVDDQGVTWVTDVYRTDGDGTYENTYPKVGEQ